MDRTSPVHYIAPSTISITPNANGSPDDLAVYVARGCKVKVYSPKAGIDYENGVAQEWEMSGRNRRLGESNKPYTIYVRLPKRFKDRGYLVFAAKTYADGGWHDTYPYITPDGESAANTSEYWYLRLGDVTLPENGQRTVTYDTGILGTEQFNTEWALNPDSLPLRIELGCTVNDEDAGPTPYVYWGQSLVLTAMLTEGWTGTDIERFDHWEITRDSGNAQADTTWNAVDRSATFGQTGSITLQHGRGAGNTDDFNSAVNSTFTVKAMERTDDPEEGGTPVYAVLKSASICIMAETWEKYELSLAAQMVTYNPITQTYSPNNGVKFNIRATDQKSNTFLLSNKQLTDAGLVAQYAVVGVTPEIWTPITISGPDSNVAEGTVPASAFSTNQKSINVRLLNAVQTELHRTTIAFLRDGEDSKEREWIFLRSTEAITFGTQEHPYPASISYGEVNPTGAAGHVTNDKNQDGWVPEGWWDEQQGVDETNRFEYGAHRDFVKESGGVAAHWGTFTNPTIWNHYGTDGDDGLYYKDEYARSKSRTSHASADIDTSYGTNGWGAAAPAASGEYVYIWKRTRQWDPNNNGWATGSSWAYVCETGADGTGQPDYIQTQEAWSNAESVNNPTTEPTPNGGWSDTTPSNPNDYAYLWRRSRKMVLQSDGSYAAATGTDGQWKYTRLSGTNGTSIKTKGTIAVAITASGTWPTTGFSANDLGIKQGDATVWKFNGTAWAETSVESEDGDSYTVTKDCIIDLDGDGTSSNIKGHLVMWSAEAGKWVDLGEFKGDPGTTYYTHVAWGKDVVLSSSELPIPDGQTNRPNATSVPYFSIAPATGYNWMGILINTSSSDPTSSDKLKYTWQNTEGQQGPAGGNTATVYLYKRSTSAVTSVGIGTTLYYKFSTRKLYTNAACTTEATASQLNNWSLTIPDDSTDRIYVTAAIAYSNTESDDITSGEWVAPAQFTENGEHGINSATVFLYKRSETAISAHGITTALYYKFADGKLYTKSGSTYTEATDASLNNWKHEMPATDGNPCYVIQAAALSNEDYDQIATTDWSSVRKMVEDGDAGNGIISITRTFAISSVGTTASETTEPSHYGSWSVISPAVTEQYPYLWAKEVVVFTDTTKNTTKYYCIGAKGDNGVDAQDIEWTYIRTKTNIAPVIDNDSTYTDSNGHAYTADDHLPKVVPGTGGSTSDIDSDNSGSGSKPYECTDDPKGVNDIWKYEWEIKRTKGTAVNGRRTWNYYSGAMTLHNNLAESAFIIDTDNDNDQFGTDSESKVLVSQTRSTTVKVYDGATPQTLASLSADLKYEDGTSVSNDVATYTADASTGVVSVTILQNTTTAFSHDEIQAFITASVTGKGSKSTVFTIRKVMSGQPGLSPTIYQLNPTNKTFTFGRDASNNLTPASRSTVVNALKTIGNTTTDAALADGLTFTWGFDEGSQEGSGTVGDSSGTPPHNQISISNTQANNHYQVWVQLSTGDRETLPIVKDGEKGPAGKDSQYIYLRGTARDVDTDITTTLPAEVRVTGGNNLSLNYRGLNLVTLNRQTLAMVESINYDTYGEAVDDPQRLNNGITNLIAELNALDNSVFVCLVSSDAIGWSSDLITALQGFGMNELSYTEAGRYPFLFIGYKGLGKGNGLMRMRDKGAYTDVVELSVYVANGALTVRDGASGQSSFKSIVFKRTNDTSVQAPTGGSYSSPVPSGWSDGIPAGEEKVWSSTRIFTSDGQAPQQPAWTTPRPMTDTETYDVEFAVMQANDATPDPPDATNRHKDAYPYGYEGQVWFDPDLDKYSASGVLRDFTRMYWRAEREIKNGVPGTWTIVRIKGEQGVPGGKATSMTPWFLALGGNTQPSVPAVTIVNGVPQSVIGGVTKTWHSGQASDPAWSETYKYLYEIDHYTLSDGSDYWSNPYFSQKWSERGPQGEAAVNVVVSPASMIVEQDINNKDNIAHSATNNLGRFSIQVLKGSTACVITGISATGSHVYVSNSASQGDYIEPDPCTWQPNNQITDMYLKGIAKDGQNNYYSTGQITLSINYTDPDSNTGKTITGIFAKVYVNLIGNWSEKVEGDMKTELANSFFFEIDNNPSSPTYGQVIESENWGEFYRSSTMNISRLSRNTNTYALLTNGSECIFEDAAFSAISGKSVHLKKGKYLVYAEIDTDLLPTSNYIFTVGSYDFSGSDRIVSEEINVTTEGNYSIYINDNLESGIGSVVELYIAERYSTTSQLKQTADDITSTVQRDYATKSQLQQTADEITSEVTKLENGKNLLTGVLTGDGWKLNGSDIETDEDDKFILNGGVLESTGYQVEERDGQYTLSYEASSAPNQNNVKLYVDGELTDVPCNYGQRDGRFFVKFNSFWGDDDEYYIDGTLKFRFSGVTYIRHPQLETGANATEFVAPTAETSSRIKQTASEIDQTITTKLGQTGININGNNRTITATADHFEIWNSTKTIKTFSIDNDGNLQSSGNASFKGKITATSGAIGGFDIGQYVLTNSNWQAGIDIKVLDANEKGKIVKIGENASGINSEAAIIRAENTTYHESTSLSYNTALYLNAKGARYNYAFYGNGNGVLNGYVQGYKVFALSNIGVETNLKLADGMVQAITSVSTRADKYVYLPTLGEIRQTLGIGINDDTIDFTCRLVVINQSYMQTPSSDINRDNVTIKGDMHDYTTVITETTAKPVILRQSGEKAVAIPAAWTVEFNITYISKRFIANYIEG